MYSKTISVYRLDAVVCSTSLARTCIAKLAANDFQGVQVDMGLNAEAHTQFSENPDSAMNAFLDYMFLMDARAIVRSGSSFSGTVVNIRGFSCRKTVNNALAERGILVCFPSGYSC